MFSYELDLSQLTSFVINLSMLTIGIGFLIGFTVKKLLQFMKLY